MFLNLGEYGVCQVWLKFIAKIGQSAKKYIYLIVNEQNLRSTFFALLGLNFTAKIP